MVKVNTTINSGSIRAKCHPCARDTQKIEKKKMISEPVPFFQKMICSFFSKKWLFVFMAELTTVKNNVISDKASQNYEKIRSKVA